VSRPASPEVVATRRGVRLVQEGHVVSEVLAQPGPTHSLFDLMAACAVELTPGPRVLLLGFGGGSIVAPLRALGFSGPLEAVDLSRTSAAVFRRVAGAWAGSVHVTIADAATFLRKTRRRYDLIVEDLSLPVAGDLVMPDVCFAPLPDLIAEHLRPGGAAIINAFSPGSTGWRAHLDRLVCPGHETLRLIPDDFDHSLLLSAQHLPSAADLARRLRRSLELLRSKQAHHFALRRRSRR
jgi:hypothetical protein